MNQIKTWRRLGTAILVFMSLTVSASAYENTNSLDHWLMQRWQETVVKLIRARGYAPGPDDQAGDLVDEVKVSSLEAMKEAGLERGTVSALPWSDSYWPLYQGAIASRYADPEFLMDSDWEKNRVFLESRIGKGSSQFMSPAEKYDLLVGDSKYSLTRKLLEQGHVEPWMGLCHGWAAASLRVPRPRRSVTVMAVDGKTQIEFLPSDIKALTTLLWAEGSFRTRFLGGRCNDKDPKWDENGRAVNPDCLDTNAGTWHLVVVNQVGVKKKGFIIDADSKYEVWNHPVTAYKYSYFNPKTGENCETLEASKILLKDLPRGRFTNARAPGTFSVVGVNMEIDYRMEIYPSRSKTNDESEDDTGKASYKYELELDGSGQIIGGEWISEQHPDFLWIPAGESKAQSVGDQTLLRDRFKWNGSKPIPTAWKRAALQSSAHGQPLAKLVEALLGLAQ